MPDPNFREPREHDERYLNYIRSCPCCIPGCGDNVSVEAHHPRVSIPGVKRYTGLAEKASDKWALPLCGRHHAEAHTGEAVFWASYGIDPIALAMHYHARPR